MIHDAQTFLFPEDYSGRQARAYRALLPLIGRRARRVLTVSNFSRTSLAEQGIARLNKIDVVRNGTDHILTTSPDDSVLGKFGLQFGSYYMVLGSSKGYKNIHRIFDALNSISHDHHQLVVVGGPGVEEYIKSGWLPPKGTIFTGFVSDGQLRSLYTNAASFFFPSLTEGFGLPPLEAMHCGCPVISANAGAMPEICSDAVLYADPNDSSSWRKAISSLESSADLRKKLIEKGKSHAKRISWSTAGDSLWDIVSQLSSSDMV